MNDIATDPAKEFTLLRRQNKHVEAVNVFMQFVKANYKPGKTKFSDKERSVVKITIVTWLLRSHGIDGVVLNGVEYVIDYWVRGVHFPLEPLKHIDDDNSYEVVSRSDHTHHIGSSRRSSINKNTETSDKNAAAIAGYLVITKIGDYLLGPLFPPPDHDLVKQLQRTIAQLQQDENT